MVDEFVRIGRPAAGLRLLDARHRRIDGVGAGLRVATFGRPRRSRGFELRAD